MRVGKDTQCLGKHELHKEYGINVLFWVSMPNYNIHLSESMQFADEGSSNFYNYFFSEVLQKCNLPHVAVRIPLGGSGVLAGTGPKFRPVLLFAGLK